MASGVLLFECDGDGLMHQVPPDQVAQRRSERDCRHVNIAIDVLLTDADLAQRQADADADAASVATATQAAADRAAKQVAAEQKLADLGLTADDLAALFG
jgi:hypothetical protein